MSEYVTVSVVCKGRPVKDVETGSVSGRAHDDDPQIVYSFAFPLGATEPRGFVNAGEVLFGDRVVSLDEDAHNFDAVLRIARTGKAAHITHELKCSRADCGLTARIRDTDLQRLLRMLPTVGESEAELSGIERYARYQ